MYRTQSPDTDRCTEEKLFARYRSMTPTERMEHVSALGRLVVETALASLAARYPDTTRGENRLRLLSRRVDRETMIRLFDWDPVEKGA